MRRYLAALGAALVLALLAGRAEAFPDRPLRLIVPFGAGGTTDMVGRLFAQELGAALGQPVVVENRPGAGGNIGYAVAARAEPDGYTLLLAGTGITSSPFLYRSVPYRLEDLAPVSLLVSAPNVLIVRNTLPARSVAEFVALARSRPGELVYATAGVGSSSHVANVLFHLAAGLRLEQVNYPVGAAAFVDLLAGRADTMIYPLPETLTYIQSGRVRALAVTAPTSVAAVQGVPSMAEAGFPAAELVGWYGLFAPARTPEPILDLLHRHLAAILARPELRQRTQALSADPMPASRVEFGAYLEAQTARWSRFVTETGVRAD
ncbi:Bug family tripartite tricarboxylate transporter substrate binding protein [Siccirubricoccus phaeus]|uniref:Bug family tripartite tricarboxylate transporter substrate binding protein n=1 Tax=Siccirubricoccus phaeus TaxID=2595053 RepID=UPI0011F2DF9B|nr:tripartite tricarboxylate transporter substrate binding protein [Siccirubricoccus phaeus]